MIDIVLADCDLELVPERLCGHPASLSYCKKRGKKSTMILLDDNYHHSAIRKLFPQNDEQQRRGRPDIVHFNLVYILDSIPNKKGLVRLWIHTRNDQLITVNPSLRIPKSFPRFVGIMEKLLFEGVIKSEDEVLLEIEEEKPLQMVLDKLGNTVVKFTPEGESQDLSEIIKGDLTCVIGGFSKGEFLSEFKFDHRIRVFDEELTSWSVIAEILKQL